MKNLLGYVNRPFSAAGWRAALPSSNIRPLRAGRAVACVIAKVEVLQDKDNPRFIVTNLPAKGFEDQQQQRVDRFCAQKCYEDFYCARGDMENQIKQQYLDLEADRTSSHWMASNQLRLWFSAFALLLFQRLRTLALRGTELANATAGIHHVVQNHNSCRHCRTSSATPCPPRPPCEPFLPSLSIRLSHLGEGLAARTSPKSEQSLNPPAFDMGRPRVNLADREALEAIVE
jgi:Transposase DDE domain group 1